MYFPFSKFISISTIESLIQNKLVITIRPNWDKNVILSTLLKKSGLNANTRLGSDEFQAVLEALLYLRLNSDDVQLRLKIESILRNSTLPFGFQSLVKNLPLGGSMYRIKDHLVEFVLDDSIIKRIVSSVNDGNLALRISEISRHLKSNPNSRKESFNDNFLTSGNKYFILNSYFRKNSIMDSSRPNLELCLNSRTPELNVGTSLAFIFGFTCEVDDDFRLLLGIVGKSSLSPSDNDVNVINAFEFMIPDSSSGPRPEVLVDNNPRENLNSDSTTQFIKPIRKGKSLFEHRDIVKHFEDGSLNSKSVNILIEKLLQKLVDKLLADERLHEKILVHTT